LAYIRTTLLIYNKECRKKRTPNQIAAEEKRLSSPPVLHKKLRKPPKLHKK